MIVEAVRVLAISLISFVVALLITPFVFRFILKFNLRKHIRTSDAAPIFSKLHQDKSGTPTMGGDDYMGDCFGIGCDFLDSRYIV